MTTTTYTAAAALAAYQGGAVTTPYAVVDTEANVLANLSGLETIAYARDLASLTLTDPATTIALDPATYIADRYVFSVAGTYSVSVSGAPASDAGLFYSHHLTMVSIVDSAANVEAEIGDIHLMNGNVPYTVTLTDSGTAHFNVSVSDWTYNNTVFPNIQGGNFTITIAGAVPATSVSSIPGMSQISSVAVSDTAIGIGGGLDALEALIQDGKLSSLTMTGGTGTPVPISIPQITSDADVLALLPTGYTLSLSTNAAGAASLPTLAAQSRVVSLSIQDSGANLAANLDAIEALAAAGKVSAIVQTDYTALPLTQQQVANDAAALAKFSFYDIEEIVPAAAASTVAYQTHVGFVDISDTAANISANVATLYTLAQSSKIGHIMVTDSAPIQVSDTYYNTTNSWRFHLAGNYSFSVSGVSYGSIAWRLSDPNVVSVGVADSASEISYELNSLELLAQDGKLTSISFTDGGTPALALTGAQFTSDADALRLLTGSYSYSVTGVSVTSAASALTGSNVTSVSISDTAANLSAGMSTIETLVASGKVTSIAVSDGGTLSLTQTQVSGCAPVLAKLTGSYHLTLQNVGAASIALTGVPGHVQSASISDSAANVSANFDALQAVAAQHALTSVSLTDSGTPVLTLTGAQIDADAGVLAAISRAYKVAGTNVSIDDVYILGNADHLSTASVADNAGQMGLDIDDLQTFVANGTVTSVKVTDSGTPTLYITQTQLTNDTRTLQAITTSYNLSVRDVAVAGSAALLSQSNIASVSISDTAANIARDIDGLQSLLTAGKLVGFDIVTDDGSLTVTQSQLAADALFINGLAGSFKLAVSGVTAANAWQVITQPRQVPVQSVSVADTAANIVAHLSDLQSLATSGMLGSITLTDGGTPLLAISAAQLASDVQAISAIISNYTLGLAGLTVAQFTTQIGGGHTSAASISDSTANVSAVLDALAADVTAGSLTSIALTDGASAVLSLSETQFHNDIAALKVIVGTHQLTVSQVAAADASSVAAAANVTSINVADGAASIAANLDGLQSLLSAGKLASLTATDGGTVSISAAQMISDAQAINDIAGSYTLTVTGAADAAQLTPAVLSHVKSVSVSDSAANISSNLDSLQSAANAGKLTSIAVTGTAYANLTVSAAQLATDAAVLKDITGNYVLDITASANGGTIAGIQGHGNIVTFSGSAGDYAIAASGSDNGVTVTGAGGTEHLSGIDSIQIGSQTDIVAQAPIKGGATDTGNLTELYGAVFSRTPDVPGLGFYETFLASNPNTGLLQFATWFLDSTEYQSNTAHVYAQTTAGETQFINDSYQNLLGRTPDADDVNFYLTKVIQPALAGLTPGTDAYKAADNQAHALLLVYFSASPEFLGDVSITAQNPSSTQHWLLLTS